MEKHIPKQPSESAMHTARQLYWRLKVPVYIGWTEYCRGFFVTEDEELANKHDGALWKLINQRRIIQIV